jgi:tetratricopeptide (TPR) repeat protein
MSLLRGVTTPALHTSILTSAARALIAAAAVAYCGATMADPADAGAQATPPPSRVDAYAEFRRLFEAKDYPAAAVQAKQFAELTEQEIGPAGDDLQVALINLATAQYLAGDYVGAEGTYLRVIELADASGKPRVERLARANAGLAVTYYAGQRYDLAVQRFETAVALSRRSEGLLNEHQLPLLDKYTDSLTELGRYQDALRVQKYALRIAERKYGDRDPRVAPALEKLGRWYARVGAYDPARMSLRRAIDIVEKAQGSASPQLVGPLTALAECARLQLLDPAQQRLAAPDADRGSMFHDPMEPLPYSPTATVAEGQKALERAVAIASERPDPSPMQIADVRVQYGDWFQMRSQPERALPQYQQAWQAASRATYEGKPLSDVLFGKPVLLHYARPENWDRYASRPREEIEMKTVLLDGMVTAEGRMRDARVLDDSGDARRADQTRGAAATARYRPRFENGQPVDTPDVRFTQAWVVLIPKPDAPVPEPEQRKP